jgi:hypothetical protein
MEPLMIAHTGPRSSSRRQGAGGPPPGEAPTNWHQSTVYFAALPPEDASQSWRAVLDGVATVLGQCLHAASTVLAVGLGLGVGTILPSCESSDEVPAEGDILPGRYIILAARTAASTAGELLRSFRWQCRRSGSMPGFVISRGRGRALRRDALLPEWAAQTEGIAVS